MKSQNAAPVEPAQPAHVDRPIDATPAPGLPAVPPQATPGEPPLPDSENANPPMPPSDDLFSTPSAAPPQSPPATPPAVEEKGTVTPPATPPATPESKPADSNDLFGAPAKPESKPAEKPAETSAATPPQTPPATPPASDDLFGTPAATSPATPEAKPAEAPAEKPAEKAEDKDKDKEKKADDIFGAAPAVLHEAGGLASEEMREWVDNTGNFSVRARLVRFLDGQVRLLKENGRTTTVALSRLSAGDLEFVNRQASAQQATVLQTAQTMIIMPWMAN
jgi:hypothetical protein